MFRSFGAALLLPVLARGATPDIACTPTSTSIVTTTVSVDAPIYTDTVTDTSTVTSTVTESTAGGYANTDNVTPTTTETAPGVTVACPASTVASPETSPFSTHYTYISSQIAHKRQLANGTASIFAPLETVVVYTCRANNASSLETFVPGPAGTTNPGGAITVTLGEDVSTAYSTSTLSNGDIQIIQDDVYRSTRLGGSITTLTVPVATRIISGSTTVYTTTEANGIIEIVTDALQPDLLSGGATGTNNVPIGTSYIYPSGLSTMQYTTTLSNGVVEIIEDDVQWTVGPDGNTSTSTVLATTSYIYPTSSETVTYTTTLSDGVVEIIEDRVEWQVGQMGTTNSATIPITTSFIYPETDITRIQYTSTLSNGVVEVVEDDVQWVVDPDGTTSTSTLLATTSYSYSTSRTTTSLTSTLSNGVVEVIGESLQWVAGQNASTTTSTSPYTTIYSGPTGSSRTQYTTTVSTDNSDVEIITDALLWSVNPDGSTITSTTPIGTSFIPETDSTTTTVSGVGIEIVTQRLQPVRQSDGSLSTSTIPIGTSTIPFSSSSPFTNKGMTTTVAITSSVTLPDSSATTIVATEGTILIPDPVGNTITTAMPAVFTDVASTPVPGYVAERIYTTILSDETVSTVTENVGSYIFNAPPTTTSPSYTFASTSIYHTYFVDGRQEFATYSVFTNAINDNAVQGYEVPVGTLFIAAPIGSTSFTTASATVSGAAGVIAEAVYVLSGSTVTQALGTFVPATATAAPCPDATSTSTVMSTTAYPTSTITVNTVTTTTSTSTVVTTDPGTTTIYAAQQTATVTPHFSTLSHESYNGRYTATVTDTSGYYPVYETFLNLDFPNNDPKGSCNCSADNSASGCWGEGAGLTCETSLESCASLCVKLNNAGKISANQTCVGVVYEPVSTKCWWKSGIPPNAPGDQCGVWQSYETISGVMLADNITMVTTYPDGSDDDAAQTVYADPTYDQDTAAVKRDFAFEMLSF